MAVTVLDAGVLIGVLAPDDAHHEQATARLTMALNDRRELVICASAYAEALVHPIRRGQDAVDNVDAFIAQAPVRVVDVDRALARAAAALRARHGTALPLPDALVLSTAQLAGPDAEVLTTDKGWPDTSIRVVVV